MSTTPTVDRQPGAMETDLRAVSHDHPHGLEPELFTAEKLRYASAKHVHTTNRRFFIGPIPKGWLQHHRKSWLKSRLKFRHYTSKTVSFAAESNVIGAPEIPSRPDQSHPGPSQEVAPVDSTEGEETEREDDQDYPEPTGDLRLITSPGNEAIDGAHSTVPSSSRNSEGTDRSVDTEDPSLRRQDSASASAFYTARESGPTESTFGASPKDHKSELDPGRSATESGSQNLSAPQDDASQSSPRVTPSETGSTVPLLSSSPISKGKGKLQGPSTETFHESEPQDELFEEESGRRNGLRAGVSKRANKLNVDDKLWYKQQRVRSRIARTQDKVSGNLPYRRKAKNGEIIKTETMLVRVEQTVHDLPEDYTENDSQKVETKLVDKWREFLVVCRASSDPHARFSLQMYKTRVVPDIQKKDTRISPYYEVGLGQTQTKVNLYSSLDKTIVIWTPSKYGFKIYIVRPKSTAHAVEWYTFLRHSQGWRRPSSLGINVPDLGVSLVFKNPFAQLETGTNTKDSEAGVLARSATQETFAAAAIVRGCLDMLGDHPEWSDVLKLWSKTEKMGLAWKRYDRLEWVFGINEQKMYGSMAMQTSHELELRPRHHYSTSVEREDNREEEPEPVEGFLVRLTSQRGVHQRMNKLFFKRLYFFCQDHYLFFCRPARALPPAPPKFCPRDSNMPSADEILNQTPLSFEVDPFPLKNGEISWLSNGNKAHIKAHDEQAVASLHRNLHNITHSDGFIDLCRVMEVRPVQRDSCPADPNVQEGPDVAFNPEARDTHRDDGATQQFADDRSFELLLDNDLVVRFQAYNEITRNEWMRRLGSLVKYWKARKAADAAELKAIRQRNLELLNIDEELESVIGQYAKKWEVKRAEASPHLHNMCILSGCRAIKMSGQLYRKPRRRSTFKRCELVLTDGKLLVFQSSLRKRNGVEIPHVHSNLETTIDLEDCYIYSGLLTDSDVLYKNQTFDSNNPGHHALPRVYLSSDAYTSSDEDTAITFVIWQPLRKNFFRAREAEGKGHTKQKIKQVSSLGAHGRTIVFKARSRVEKDRWVLSIASEIDRLQEDKAAEIRVVSPENRQESSA